MSLNIGKNFHGVHNAGKDFKREVQDVGFKKAAKQLLTGKEVKQGDIAKPENRFTKESIQAQKAKTLPPTPTKPKSLAKRTTKQTKTGKAKSKIHAFMQGVQGRPLKEHKTIQVFRQMVDQKLNEHLPKTEKGQAKKNELMQTFDAISKDKKGFKSWVAQQQEGALKYGFSSAAEDLTQPTYVYDQFLEVLKQDPQVSEGLETVIGHGYDALSSDALKEDTNTSPTSFKHTTATEEGKQEALSGYKAGLDYREQIRTDINRLRSAKGGSEQSKVQGLIQHSRNNLASSISYLKDKSAHLPEGSPERENVDRQISDLSTTLQITDSIIDGGFKLDPVPTRLNVFVGKLQDLKHSISQFLKELGSDINDKTQNLLNEANIALDNFSFNAQLNTSIKLDDLNDLLNGIDDALLQEEISPSNSDSKTSAIKNLRSAISTITKGIEDIRSHLKTSRIETPFDSKGLGFDASNMHLEAMLDLGNTLSDLSVGVDDIQKIQRSFSDAFQGKLQELRESGYSSGTMESEIKSFAHDYITQATRNFEEY